jgi:hypothetical protein
MGRIASPKSNQGLCSIGSSLDLQKDFQRKLARAMVPGSLQLAIAPPALLRGKPVFSSSRAAGYGFAVVYIFQGSGAATPERCRRCSVQDWPSTRTEFAPTPPQRGPCGCAASPGRVFFAPALGTGARVLLSDGGQGNRILASKDFTNSRLESLKHPRLLDFHLSRQLQYSSHLG